jgi:Putative zinc-finger
VSAHVVDRLSAYLDGELEAADRREVEAHLRLCGECARHLEDLAAVDELARALPLEAPGGYFETLPARVRFKVAAGRRRGPRLPVWSWAVAAALLLAVVTPALLKRNPELAEVPRSVAPVPAAPLPSRLSDSKEQPAGGASLPEAAEEKQRSPASYDEVQSAARKRAPAPGLRGPAAAPAPAVGFAQGTLASNEAAAPLAKVEVARAKDKALEGVSEKPAGAPGTPAASATFAPPPEAAVEGAAGQHLFEPKPEADDADSPAAVGEAKKVGSATRSASAARRDAEAGRAEPPAPKLRFRTLAAAVASNVEDARRLREQWRSFVAQGPSAAQADEGRVRIVQMGVQAWHLSNDPGDLVLVKRDGEDYLRRADAAQGDRVRALLSTVGN